MPGKTSESQRDRLSYASIEVYEPGTHRRAGPVCLCRGTRFPLPVLFPLTRAGPTCYKCKRLKLTRPLQEDFDQHASNRSLPAFDTQQYRARPTTGVRHTVLEATAQASEGRGARHSRERRGHYRRSTHETTVHRITGSPAFDTRHYRRSAHRRSPDYRRSTHDESSQGPDIT